jgi:uridine kinase
LTIELHRPVLVAVDGLDAAGKTTLASELSTSLRQEGSYVIEASIDGFHNPRDIRYKRGRDDPEGYYRDSFDLEALKKHLLVPLKVGCMRYSTQVFDYTVDKTVESTKNQAEQGSILVFDGVFTHRPELRCYWNYSIYLYIDEDECLRRGAARNPDDPEEARRRYKVRYLAGQKIYHDESNPMKHASIIIDNTDPQTPLILGESK